MKNLHEIKKKGLCVGCGLCSAIHDKELLEIKNLPKEGLRPEFSAKYFNEKQVDKESVRLCPGVHQTLGKGKEEYKFDPGFGHYLEIWEGYASDPAIRRKGSSGGIITAISAMCLEKKGYHSTLHTRRSDKIAWQNETCFSCNMDDLMKTTGSRYAPSSPCDGLNNLVETEKYVFVGKPCDCGGYRNWERVRDLSDENLVLGFFCAGVPSEQGIFELMKKQGINPEDIDTMDYRSEGWPGEFQMYNHDNKVFESSYLDSWSFLQRYRHFRCHLCPDGFSEQADISTGDAWHRLEEGTSDGKSIIIVRTELGKKIIREAMDVGYITCVPSEEKNVTKGQGLTQRRKMVWGRFIILRLFFLSFPKYSNYRLRDSWKSLGLKEKVSTYMSTVSRIIKRKFIITRSINRINYN